MRLALLQRHMFISSQHLLVRTCTRYPRIGSNSTRVGAGGFGAFGRCWQEPVREDGGVEAVSHVSGSLLPPALGTGGNGQRRSLDALCRRLPAVVPCRAVDR